MNETVRVIWLRIFLRVLSVGFIAAFIPWITLILLNAPILAPGGRLAPLLRFQPYNPYYESMMAAIHVAWAVMLWRASDNPAKHTLFIDFTIWANAAHGLVMLIATPIQKGLVMTVIEGAPLMVIAGVLWLLRPPEDPARMRYYDLGKGGGGSISQTRIIVTHYGGPDALEVVEEERPEPKDGEVRVRVLAAGVALPDLMMREGIHPETPTLPFTPGWDLVGVVDRLGGGISGIEPGEIVAALPISGAYAQFVCLPQRELVPVPSGLDPAEAVSLVLNYITAYQMLNRSAKVRPGQRVLIHGAAGGVGTALLQLGRLAGLQMYGTCSSRGASAVSDLGGIPIDYQHQDFVKEIHRLTSEGVDVVLDSMGGTHIWRSRKALRPGGKVVAYGLTSSLREGRLASGRSGQRHRFRAIAVFGWYIAGGWLLPGRRRVVPYSIQWLKRLRPALFRQDLIALFDLLKQQKIKPLIAQRFPLAEARHAHELLGKGGVTGKIVLVSNEASLESRAA
jgi:NADPH2:quinone reductase